MPGSEGLGPALLPGQILLRLIRSEPASPAGAPVVDDSAIDWALVDGEGLLALAARHRLAGWLAVRLAAAEGVPPDLAAELRSVRAAVAARQLMMQVDLADTAALLTRERIPWLVVKGPALAQLAYATPEERDYSDLDLLVAPASFGRCLDVLEQAGNRLLDRNWPAIAATRRGELSVALRHQTSLDLHWSLLNTPRLRSSFAFDTDTLLDRAVEREVGSGPVRTLDAADNLVYVSLHAVLAGAHQLSWLLDVSRLERLVTDWERVVDRARDLRAALPLAVALCRAGAVTGLPPVPGVIESLVGSRLTSARLWLSSIRWLGARSDSAWVWTGRTGRSVISSTRTGSGTSLRALLALARVDLAGKLSHQRSDAMLDELRRSDTGTGHREVFLASIQAEARDKGSARCNYL